MLEFERIDVREARMRGGGAGRGVRSEGCNRCHKTRGDPHGVNPRLSSGRVMITFFFFESIGLFSVEEAE
jgi:hypothetical protein